MHPPLYFDQNSASFFGQMKEPILTMDEVESCLPNLSSSLEREFYCCYLNRVATDEPDSKSVRGDKDGCCSFTYR